MGARIGGRNLVASWIVGVLCAAIVAALLWLALPAGPGLVVVLTALLDSTLGG
ncbi:MULTISPECIES: hypothetical protein [Microbacterium]|uniref:hypothetical protein n=1 Tax=Microbacterium TaxID=33882 RepID=UPI00217E34BE|nr:MULTISPECIES: hypothetical protein [Microbacterium]UWF77206.1 hypothetical protein JSY13_10500 [Microbacterium neungamense]WCM55362.1 hypothetical protein JRG78_10485 [Microbacterium sp. EF45047]